MVGWGGSSCGRFVHIDSFADLIVIPDEFLFLTGEEINQFSGEGERLDFP
jgi:hypothetical protein